MIIRKATVADASAIHEMRSERASWLRSMGSDQWTVGLTEGDFDARIQDSISAGETYIADLEGAAVGTIAVDTWTNDGLWTDAERSDSLIVHRMITRRSVAGLGIGAALLRHADNLAVLAGRRWLRLDAWTTNTALHTYYQQAGFVHVRTVSDHRSHSTACFQRRAEIWLDSTEQRTIVRTDGPRDTAFDPIPADHTAWITEISVRRPAILGGDSVRPLLDVHPGGHWLLWWRDRWYASPSMWGGKNRASRPAEKDSVAVINWPRGEHLNKKVEYVADHTVGSTRVSLYVR